MDRTRYAVAPPDACRLPASPTRPGYQAVHPALRLQQLAGNRAVAGLQAKLTINQPGDRYEVEADRVADQVMRMPEPQVQRKCACGGTCDECQEEEGQLHRAASG